MVAECHTLTSITKGKAQRNEHMRQGENILLGCNEDNKSKAVPEEQVDKNDQPSNKKASEL